MLYDIHLPEIKPIKEDGNTATFAIEPLYPGYGMTLGNSLRRVILSSLTGAAVTAVKIDNVSHEFSTIPGVKEDVVEILLNLKQLRFKTASDQPEFLMLTKSGRGVVKAKDIKPSGGVEIANPELEICTIENDKTKLGMEIRVEQGRGYVPVEDRSEDKLPVGMIAVDAIYTPVKRVRYNIEHTRVGQMTDLDRLVMEIETDGTMTPSEAIAQAARILVDHFTIVAGGQPESRLEGSEDERGGDGAVKIMVEEVNFSPRTTNALLNNDIKTIKDVLELSDQDLRDLKGFGSKAYDEVKAKLAELNLVEGSKAN